MPAFSDARLTIDLGAVAANYQLLARKAAGAQCSAVVKANAYGLGVEPVATRLKDEGCTLFFVAHLDEALELRAILPDTEIAVFHGFGDDAQRAEFEKHNLIPVINHPKQAAEWDAERPAILHVDTGMNRLGMMRDDAKALASERRNWRAVMSHLACISEPDHELNTLQLQRFDEVCALFPGIPASMANSGGVMVDAAYHYDMVRPGCSLYGVNNVPSIDAGLAQPVTLTAKIVQLRALASDEPVGYGATQIAKAGSTLATLPVGYADGYLRCLGAEGAQSFGTIGGINVPLVGRVSMDMVVVDVSHVPQNALDIGAEVTLIGEHLAVDALAQKAGTIGYEILTSLGSRYARDYV